MDVSIFDSALAKGALVEEKIDKNKKIDLINIIL